GPANHRPLPRRIACLGSRPGVGCTTLAVNLAVAVAAQGARVVLVDAHWPVGRIAAQCSAAPQSPCDQLPAGRLELANLLQPGPGGVCLLVAEPALDAGEHGVCQSLASQLRGLSQLADTVVLDLGSHPLSGQAELWHTADQGLLVTTPDPPAIVEACSALKSLHNPARHNPAGPTATGHNPAGHRPVGLVLSRVAPAHAGQDAWAPIDQACRLFFGQTTVLTGTVPEDSRVLLAAEQQCPVTLAFPGSAAAYALRQLAARCLSLEPILET
ncbi:MAG: hypothetical protein J5I93_24385, partial [Pirellulaceae bacterium]|nr:hypothetical protein [Pirellulaceae bacterium]